MAKSQISFWLLVIAAILSVEMRSAMAGEKECYEIHPEILCERGNKDKCSAFCKKKFGPSTAVQCIENAFMPGPFCVLSSHETRLVTQPIVLILMMTQELHDSAIFGPVPTMTPDPSGPAIFRSMVNVIPGTVEVIPPLVGLGITLGEDLHVE
ncbi:hypothetical protein BUALT_Bualt12G0016400 [Buddleja alternifolia]|uniref:Uncharacterized protein n=1 Tax=Buddleja alternifolia TaxID=168488 RepID=A0AAV6WN92_9LAMI|nr:hypothetical protein BUALT_Bualt12G0016400 [Buddleja alternifolia]